MFRIYSAIKQTIRRAQCRLRASWTHLPRSALDRKTENTIPTQHIESTREEEESLHKLENEDLETKPRLQGSGTSESLVPCVCLGSRTTLPDRKSATNKRSTAPTSARIQKTNHQGTQRGSEGTMCGNDFSNVGSYFSPFSGKKTHRNG